MIFFRSLKIGCCPSLLSPSFYMSGSLNFLNLQCLCMENEGPEVPPKSCAQTKECKAFLKVEAMKYFNKFPY